jgi:hypothetical protein
MTPKEKAGCGIAIIALFLRLPLGLVLYYWVLQKIEATPEMWLLFWIAIPITLILEIGGKLIENGIAGKE